MTNKKGQIPQNSQINENDEDKQLKETKKTINSSFNMMFGTIWIFGIPAFLGYFLGSGLDNYFDIKPFGSLITLAITFITSWLIIIWKVKKISKG